MWSTFDETGGMPFDSLPGPADHIRCRLGLARVDAGKAMLILEYTIPVNLETRFPTVADACSSQMWLSFFRPAHPGAGFGWTMAWPECEGLSPSA